ncbi:MAG TPA: GTPase ObgE [Acidimicrobiia bacterium]|nr:GTPase ObgE [Acidimicrobiia bacterium]
MFVDRVQVHLRGGNGGAGVASFVRRRGLPKGRPNGGSGGRGGAVLAVADEGVATLLSYQRNPHHRAGNGTHGQGDLQHGKNGQDLVLPVPPGTSIYDQEGNLVADLVEPGQSVTLVKGGRGGRGNAAFVSPANRAPSVAEQGEYGPERDFTFEMKLLADAALIGFPNAGKSTLISVVSAAKPKIAAYPFTTLEPNLGVVEVDGREFVLADIPGLIEGAAEGKGLGHEFLRHTERAQALVVLLDPSPVQSERPLRPLESLVGELERYSPELAARPRLVVIGKSDLPEATEAATDLPDALSISSLTGEGIPDFLHATADLVDLAQRQTPDRPGYVLHRPVEVPFTVRQQDGIWLVEGVAARRAVAFADLTNPEAADMAATRLRRMGVDAALAAAGAEAGDEVQIGDLSFEYLPEPGEEE